MIKVLIRQAAKKRDLENAYQFGQSVGFSDRVALRIWNNDQPPKLKTLDRICNAWGCQLSELIEHRLDKPSRNGHTNTTPQKQPKPARSASKANRRSAGSRRSE